MSTYSKPLQTIRFISAVMIFLRHWVFFNTDPNFVDINSHVFSYFYSSITFFFILSGWSLTHVYYEKIRNNTFRFKRYLTKRLVRLYPIHIVTLLIVLILGWPQALRIPTNVYIANIFLVHAFIPLQSYVQSFDGISWTLSIFLFWYLLFPYVMLALIHFDRFMRKYALVVALLLIGGLGLWIYRNTFNESFQYALYFSPYERLIDFMVGVCIFFVIQQFENKVKTHEIFWTVVECIVVGILIVIQWYAPSVPDKFAKDVYFILPWAAICGVFAISGGYLSRILSWDPLVILGSVSLEFFLIHSSALRWIYSFVSPVIGMTQLQMLLASFVVTLIASFLIHHILSRLFRPLTV